MSNGEAQVQTLQHCRSQKVKSISYKWRHCASATRSDSTYCLSLDCREDTTLSHIRTAVTLLDVVIYFEPCHRMKISRSQCAVSAIRTCQCSYNNNNNNNNTWLASLRCLNKQNAAVTQLRDGCVHPLHSAESCGLIRVKSWDVANKQNECMSRLSYISKHKLSRYTTSLFWLHSVRDVKESLRKLQIANSEWRGFEIF